MVNPHLKAPTRKRKLVAAHTQTRIDSALKTHSQPKRSHLRTRTFLARISPQHHHMIIVRGVLVIRCEDDDDDDNDEKKNRIKSLCWPLRWLLRWSFPVPRMCPIIIISNNSNSSSKNRSSSTVARNRRCVGNHSNQKGDNRSLADWIVCDGGGREYRVVWGGKFSKKNSLQMYEVVNVCT